MQWPSRPRIHNACSTLVCVHRTVRGGAAGTEFWYLLRRYILVYIREDCAEDVLRIPDPMQALVLQLTIQWPPWHKSDVSQVNSRMVERCNAEAPCPGLCGTDLGCSQNMQRHFPV